MNQSEPHEPAADQPAAEQPAPHEQGPPERTAREPAEERSGGAEPLGTRQRLGRPDTPSRGDEVIDEVIYAAEPVVEREPRSARDVRSSRRRPRFGIGAAMLLITVLAFQYALINYFGSIAAMAIPPVVCGVLIAFVVGAEVMVWRRPGGEARRWSRWTSGWGVAYIFLLGVSAYLTGGAQIGYEWFQQWRLEKQLQRDLGFTHGKPYVWGQNRPQRKAVVMLLVEPGGPLGQAGLVTGDVVITELSPAEWFQMVHENRGRPIEVTVSRYVPGRSIDDFPHRQLEVMVPARSTQPVGIWDFP